MTDKKQTESFIINRFRENFPDFPKGKLNPSESPDFILGVTPKQKIGIELTGLHAHGAGRDLLSYENITACLENKNEKLLLYRKKKLDEYWLVIFINSLHSWNRTNMHNKLITWDFKTGFNRVFLFNAINGRVFELNQG